MGITYDISVSGGSLNSTSATFRLEISGINAVTDLEGGRSAVNDFAIGGINSLTGVTGTSAFGTFTAGGLNSSGCNGSGNFFCFNGPATNTSPALAANSTIDIFFTLNLTSGTFVAWAASGPAFKIDWLGNKNNYDLVSQDFVGSVGPTPLIGGETLRSRLRLASCSAPELQVQACCCGVVKAKHSPPKKDPAAQSCGGYRNLSEVTP